jgi:adenosylhomocysteine nucleosidase
LLVFVAAERRELEALVRHCEGIRRPDWPLDFARIGQLRGAPVALVANGPGSKLAGAAVDLVKEREQMDALISTGFCGGLEPSLGPCEIFVAGEVVGAGPALSPTSSLPFKSGKLLSLDRVVWSAKEKRKLAESGASAVDMEALAVGERARQWNVPFYAIRVVSDTCDETFPLDFNQFRGMDGRFSRTRIAGAALKRPVTVMPELMRLNKRTKRAAQALGDFLADSRF